MDLDDIPALELDEFDAALVKAAPRGGKYYRRVPTGNPKRPWRYYYTREEYERDHGERAHVAGREVAQQRERAKNGEVRLSKKELLHTLKHGTFSIISAGRNPAHPAEARLAANHPKFAARHEELRRELTKLGMKYTEVLGHYGGKEKSFIVYHHDEARPEKQIGERAMMVHHDSPSQFAIIRELGKKFNQDSVIHSHAGKHEMHFTTGPNAGKHHKGEGHKIKPHAKDFYTRTPTKRGATKFALNFDFDTYHPHETAMHKSHVVQGEMDMLESTAELREQIKMMVAQEDPMAKGLCAFEPGYGRQSVNRIPDEYLAAYLDAFIEEAFEHEKRERCHDESAAIMGISQPSANGGVSGDEADWWAQWVMHELVIYCGKNENLMRACALFNVTKDFVAARLRALGLVKPSMDGGTLKGTFLEGYQFSEEQLAAGIDKSLSVDGGAFPSEEDLMKAVQRANSVLAAEEKTVSLDGGSLNPVEMLANMHRVRFAVMRAVYGLDSER